MEHSIANYPMTTIATVHYGMQLELGIVRFKDSDRYYGFALGDDSTELSISDFLHEEISIACYCIDY